MPLYEYLCESCGRQMEVMQSFSDPPPAGCDRCGGPVKKLLSAPGIHFKGSGWYVSDYARGGTGAAGSGAARDESKSESKGDSKSDGRAPAEGTGEKKTESPAAAPPAPAKGADPA